MSSQMRQPTACHSRTQGSPDSGCTNWVCPIFSGDRARKWTRAFMPRRGRQWCSIWPFTPFVGRRVRAPSASDEGCLQHRGAGPRRPRRGRNPLDGLRPRWQRCRRRSPESPRAGRGRLPSPSVSEGTSSQSPDHEPRARARTSPPAMAGPASRDRRYPHGCLRPRWRTAALRLVVHAPIGEPPGRGPPPRSSQPGRTSIARPQRSETVAAPGTNPRP